MLFMMQIPPIMGVRDTVEKLLPEIAVVTDSSRVGLYLGSIGVIYCRDKRFANADYNEIMRMAWTYSITLDNPEGKIFLHTFARIDKSDIKAMQVMFERVFLNAQKYDSLLQNPVKDALTQLSNKKIFRECLEREILRCSCLGSGLCLIFLDIDNFKHINDNFGHLVGDKVLCEAAEIIQASVRKKDIVARFGGDEFIVLLPGMFPGEETAVLDRLLQKIESLEKYKVDISYGTAYYPQDGATPEKLIETADRRMYEQKKKKLKGDVS